MKLIKLVLMVMFSVSACLVTAEIKSRAIGLTRKIEQVQNGKKILYIEREQYANDRHNMATLFQYGEFNEALIQMWI